MAITPTSPRPSRSAVALGDAALADLRHVVLQAHEVDLLLVDVAHRGTSCEHVLGQRLVRDLDRRSRRAWRRSCRALWRTSPCDRHAMDAELHVMVSSIGTHQNIDSCQPISGSVGSAVMWKMFGMPNC